MTPTNEQIEAYNLAKEEVDARIAKANETLGEMKQEPEKLQVTK